jgi:hypothetical protein
MNLKSLLVLAVATVALSASAATSPQARRIVIEPVQVAFDKNWLARMNEQRGRTQALSTEAAGLIAADFAASLQSALGEAMRARGFEVVSVPSPGAMRLSARIEDLYVNAPEVRTSGMTKSFVREAGRATLLAEGRDASGAVRLQTEHRGTAGDTGRLARATDVTNRFWFDALFRNWASEVAAEMSERAAR